MVDGPKCAPGTQATERIKMPDVAAPAAAPQSGAAPAAPAGQSAPQAAQSAIDPAEFQRFKSEYERLSPMEQQFKNGTRFYQEASKYGLKDENALKSWGGFISKASTKGMSPEKLAALFEDQQEPEAPKPLTVADLEKFHNEREQKRTLAEARANADKELESELDFVSEAKIKERFGTDVSPEFVELMRAAGIGYHIQNRQQYPDGTPLAGQYGGVGKDWSGRVESFWNKGLTAAQAHKLAKLGDAARKPAISSSAGNNSSGGRPADKPSTQGMTREQVIAAADEAARQKLGLATA